MSVPVSALRASVEQKRCLAMSVQEEVQDVQQELLAVQRAMLQDESQAVCLRK